MTESALAVIGWQTLGSALVNLREKAVDDAADPPPADTSATATESANGKAQSSSVIGCRRQRERLGQLLDDLLHGDVFPKYVTLLCALVEVEQSAWGGYQHLWEDFAQLRQLIEQAHHLVVMCKSMKKWEIVRRSSHMKQIEAVRAALERFGDPARLEEARAAHAAVQRHRGAAAVAISIIDGANGKPGGASARGAAAVPAAVPAVFWDYHGLLPEVEAQLKRTQQTGIVGIAGVGKTSIAQRVFDRVKGRFAGCAVFLTVGRDPDPLVLLRHAAAALLPGAKIKITSAREGREQITQELARQELHTLLVLDDVWHQEHVEALDFATPSSGCHQDSRLLVTTRHERVLRQDDGSAILNDLAVIAVPVLDATQAAQLLRMHALADGAAAPPGGSAVLDKLAAVCMPVPLALQQVGAALSGRSVDEWREVLRRLEEMKWGDAAGEDAVADPETAILQQCKLSYDVLPPALQECFLHCAAYPEAARVPAGELEALWAAQAPLPCAEAHTRASMQLQELLRRRLIAQDEAEVCVVHDIMWQVACGEAQARGGFMYGHGGAPDCGVDNGSGRSVRPGTVAPERSASLTQRARALWPRRRSEETTAVLHASVAPGTALSASVPSSKAGQLRTLFHLRCSAPAALSEATACSSLRFLSLAGSTFVELPDTIGDLRMLETLILRGCKHVKGLPERLGDCVQMRVLDLAACSALRALPDRLTALAMLHTLVVRGCTVLRTMPEELAGLVMLRTLCAANCATLEALSEDIGTLQRLQTLDVAHCAGLTGLPESVSDAVWLESVKLDGCVRVPALPKRLGDLKMLRKLSLVGCTGISALPSTIGDCVELVTLRLQGCTGITALPERLGDVSRLQTLDVSGCVGLTALPERLGDLSHLELLDASRCTALAVVPERIGDCGRLRELRLADCGALAALPPRIGELRLLRELNLELCEILTKLPDGVCELAQLQTLNLKWCKALVELPERLGRLEELLSLSLERCYTLLALPESTCDLRKLTTLNIKWCKALTAMPAGLGEMQQLETLNMTWCKCVKTLPEAIGSMASLHTLVLERCYAITDIPESVCDLPLLRVLNLKWCKALTALPKSLSKLSSLQSLNLLQCGALAPGEITRAQTQVPCGCQVEADSSAMLPQE